MSRRDHWNCRNEACLNQCGDLDAVEGQLNKALAALGDETRMRMSAELECERLRVESQHHRDEWNDSADLARKFAGLLGQARAERADLADALGRILIDYGDEHVRGIARRALARLSPPVA